MGSRKLHAAIEALEAAAGCIQAALACHSTSAAGTPALNFAWGSAQQGSISGATANTVLLTRGLDLSDSGSAAHAGAGSKKGKPGAWMLDAVNKVREEAAAEDIPP